ncbi:hypothetical protein C8R43DRAFT_1236898 [Mycena crocata]|nr:hypothetical protein C8R43DRAFT_1236898 [Mycena crocata]
MDNQIDSVADLQKRIEELSSAISLQREVLLELEKAKSGIQGRLNAILDPVTRLPLELSSDIFLRCLPDEPVSNQEAAPMLLLSVCHSWSDIALSTPLLWATICVHTPRHRDFPKLMERWISRAQSRLLNIALKQSFDQRHAFPSPNEAICSLIRNNAQRVETLKLYLPDAQDLRHLIVSFPSLTNLTIGQSCYDDDEESSDGECDYAYDPLACIQLLTAAPNLVECSFTRVSYEYRSPRNTSYTTLASLKHLTDDAHDSAILYYVTLPALESLRFPRCSIESRYFLSFLARSAPPLRSLHLWIPHDWSDETGLDVIKEFCTLLPNLTELELHFSQHANARVGNFLLINVVTGRDYLPLLRTLTFRGYDETRTICETLVNFLITRRSQLESFRFIFPLYFQFSSSIPDADLAVRFRELVAAGMRIHIGPETRNYI